MTRVARYKLGYLTALTFLAIIAILSIRLMGAGVDSILIVAGVFFIPGRIQGIYYRDVFKGRRLLDAGQPSATLDHFKDFLHAIRDEPWRKYLLWLSWSVYTPDAEAMTFNNIGT